jgi:TonB family protein
MLQTLLESQAARHSSSFGTAASTAIHLVLITLAVSGTVAHARSEDPGDPPPVILTWHKPAPAPAPQTPPGRTSTRPAGDVHPASTPSISIDISPNIPDVSIPLGTVRRDDFSPSAGFASDPAPSPSGLGSGNNGAPYDSYQVDVPVAPMGGTAPAYPASMRSAAIEGEVKAEFVVDRKGRADAASLRIISSTREEFSTAVRDALPRMRFQPARLRGEPVAQLVQQLFVFRLNR